MWKWALVALGVVFGISILGFAIYIIADPQGFADFVIAWDEDIDLTVDGKTIEATIEEFEEGLGPEDRGFAVKKMMVLLARKLENEESTRYWEEYSRALEEVAEDRLLTAEENTRLREMFSDFVSEEDVNNWFEELRKLEEKGKLDDADEIWP